MTEPTTNSTPAPYVAIDRLVEAAGGPDANAYRSALRTAVEAGVNSELIEEAYWVGRRCGHNPGLFDINGNELPF